MSQRPTYFSGWFIRDKELLMGKGRGQAAPGLFSKIGSSFNKIQEAMIKMFADYESPEMGRMGCLRDWLGLC
jgi:hypothetical protein